MSGKLLGEIVTTKGGFMVVVRNGERMVRSRTVKAKGRLGGHLNTVMGVARSTFGHGILRVESCITKTCPELDAWGFTVAKCGHPVVGEGDMVAVDHYKVYSK